MTINLIIGDALEQLRLLPADSAHCCVTSPPYYGLRDYGCAGQIGLEPTPDAYIAALVAVFHEVRRVLRPDGTLWVNIGDSYATHRNDNNWLKSGATAKYGNHGIGEGVKPKDLIGIPWMLAFALRADGWWLRQDIIWAKLNPMPESVTDRCTKAHEYLFLLSKSERYWYDAAAIAEAANYPEGPWGGRNPRPGIDINGGGQASTSSFGKNLATRNKRSVWTVASTPFAKAHFATFPPALIAPAILAGCPRGGTVIDPFAGAGTTGLVADRLGRDSILIELNPTYCTMIKKRITNDAPLFVEFMGAQG